MTSPKKKQLSFWGVVFSYPTQQQWTISGPRCDMRWKVNRIWQPKTTSSVVGPRSSYKALSKSKFAPKKGQGHSLLSAAAAAKSLQSCPTLCDPISSSPSGSPVPGILQARTLEWVAISFSNAWKCKVKVKSLSHVRLLATPWTAACQAPISMDFPGKSTGVGCHCLLRLCCLLLV